MRIYACYKSALNVRIKYNLRLLWKRTKREKGINTHTDTNREQKKNVRLFASTHSTTKNWNVNFRLFYQSNARASKTDALPPPSPCSVSIPTSIRVSADRSATAKSGIIKTAIKAAENKRTKDIFTANRD